MAAYDEDSEGRTLLGRADRYAYRVVWSEEDGQCLGLCAEFPSLSWLAPTPEKALRGIRDVAAHFKLDKAHLVRELF
jgi:hypothetical protein